MFRRTPSKVKEVLRRGMPGTRRDLQEPLPRFDCSSGPDSSKTSTSDSVGSPSSFASVLTYEGPTP